MDVYKQKLDRLKTQYGAKLGAKQTIENRMQAAQVSHSQLSQQIEITTKTIALLQKTAEEARLRAKVYLETIVTDALKYISGADYEFEIDIQELRGKPDAEFYVVSDVNGVRSRQRPQDACGGGFVDIISVALRYAYRQLFTNPTIGGFMGFDEPGKMISEQASAKFAEFVKQLCTTFDTQTIIVTHNENLQAVADQTYIVSISNGSSVVMDVSQQFKGEDEI